MPMFPDDENGDVLRRMHAQGGPLTLPRNIDFTVVFETEDAAAQFADHFKNLGYPASIERTGVRPALPWDVRVIKEMTPDHRDITDFECELQDVATTLDGENDGWGCFTLPTAH